MEEKEKKSAAEHSRQKVQKRTLIYILVAIGFAVAVVLSFALAGRWSTIFGWVGLGHFSQTAKDAPFSLHVLDVGKADAMVVSCQNKTIVIDGGTTDGGDTLTTYLQQMDVSQIDLVINTHPDNDHLQGLKQVGEHFTVNQMIVPDLPQDLLPSTDEYLSTMEVYQEKDVPIKQAVSNETVWLDELKIEFLAPLQFYDTMNNNSVVVKLTYGDTSFLMMGDAEKEEEQDLINSGANLQADVIKIGHHGSKTSTTQEFLNAVQPDMAVISVGPDKNELPKSEVLQRLEKSNVKTYRTDSSGTVIFMSDGADITVATEQ